MDKTAAVQFAVASGLAKIRCSRDTCFDVATRDVNGVLYCGQHGIEAKEQHLADEGVCSTMICHAGFVRVDGGVLSVV